MDGRYKQGTLYITRLMAEHSLSYRMAPASDHMCINNQHQFLQFPKGLEPVLKVLSLVDFLYKELNSYIKKKIFRSLEPFLYYRCNLEEWSYDRFYRNH